MAKPVMGGATIDGRKPLPSIQIHEYGTRGSEGNATLKQSDVAEQGASDPGTGKKLDPKPSTPDLNSPKAEGERISTGTTAEEQKKRLAARMYPSSRGLGEY